MPHTCKDVAVVSFHENGFWQADLYKNAEHWDDYDWMNGPAPDAFFTLKKDPNINVSDAMDYAHRKWPGAIIVEAAIEDEDIIHEE